MEEFKEHDCHCGPYNWPDWLKRWMSKWFNGPCREHDRRYAEGVLAKEEYDKMFLTEMLDLSDRWYKKIVAFIFYLGVGTKWGQKSWDRNREMEKE